MFNKVILDAIAAHVAKWLGGPHYTPAEARMRANYEAVQGILVDLDDEVQDLTAELGTLCEELENVNHTLANLARIELPHNTPKFLRFRVEDEIRRNEELAAEILQDQRTVVDEILGTQREMARRGAQLVRLHNWREGMEEVVVDLHDRAQDDVEGAGGSVGREN